MPVFLLRPGLGLLSGSSLLRHFTDNTPKLLVKFSEHPLLGIAFHKPGIGPIFKSCTESRVGSQRHAQSKLNYTNVMHNTAFGEIDFED